MRPLRGRLLRPLLHATRADVRRFLAERALPFAIDRTNADLRHLRNRVRRLVVPLLEAEFNPRLAPALAALATRLRDEDDLLSALAAARLSALRDGEGLHVPADEPPALARRMIRAWLEESRGCEPTAAHVERVLALVRGQGRGAVAVPGPGRVRLEGDRLVHRPGRAAQPVPFALPLTPGGVVGHPAGIWRLALSAARPATGGEQLPTNPGRALFDADLLPDVLEVRSLVPGDRVTVPGVGTRKLQDVLVDAKVPRETRAAVPVLVGAGEVLWVAGVLRGAGARIGAGTTRVVEGALLRLE
jgi:tRNA(Ile)-lysidine synthase